eukprot:TRINITY_DN19349_c0_g1_i1.p1 TRINITY_DN19349_c0_g1~~TRINITY_DN19349_c0_g1_i1.p1  ORF type:complete len:416 (+),score=83.74 TRINITY_DN19349_c0_g1_i1:44-1249(+)
MCIRDSACLAFYRADGATRHLMCWFPGALNYAFLLNGHIWACGLASRLLSYLISRLSQVQATKDKAQHILMHVLTARNILIFDVALGLLSSTVVLTATAEQPPYHLRVTGGGCWTSAASGHWLIIAPLAVFVLTETGVCVATVWWLVNHHKMLPRGVSSFFRSVLQFTSAILVADWVLSIFIAGRHGYLLYTDADDNNTETRTEVQRLMVVVENAGYSAGYPFVVAVLFVSLLPARLLDAKNMLEAFTRFQEPAEDGDAAEWRNMQECLIRTRNQEFHGWVNPYVQAWQQENASDLPTKFICYAVESLVEFAEAEPEVDIHTLVEDSMAFDTFLWEQYDRFTEEKIKLGRARSATGFVRVTDQEEDEDDEGTPSGEKVGGAALNIEIDNDGTDQSGGIVYV